MTTLLPQQAPVSLSDQRINASVPGSTLVLIFILAFAVLATAIITRGPKWLTDFDQSFYITIAHDLNRHGVFSNGPFDEVDSTSQKPPPGMFFGPLYPALIAGVMKLDSHLAESVACAVENSAGKRPASDCRIYVRSMHLLHALLLALGVTSIAWTALLIFGSRAALWLTGALATAALVADAELFSFLMTESLSFSLYSVVTFAVMLGGRSGSARTIAAAGMLLGLLCLARPSFQVLVPFFAILLLLGRFLWTPSVPVSWPARGLAFLMGVAVVVTPWLLRNYVSIGKVGFTEEYGSAALIERFAFNDMTLREYALAFPYCVPVVGPALVDRVAGPSAMARFQWDADKSFFQQGRAHRLKLVETHGKLDAVMRELLGAEIFENGLPHLLVSLPLAWCGMWVGGPLALLLVPSFWWACLRAPPVSRNLLLAYASAGFVMLGLHGVVANHYPRYNLILIGPFAVAAAWIMLSFVQASRRLKPAAS